MTKRSMFGRLSRLSLVAAASLALAGGGMLLATPGVVFADGQAVTGSGSAQALQAEAIKAIRAGEWTRTSELISKAAQISDDPSLSRMSKWIADFESQRQEFAAERRKQYDETVVEVRKLVDAGHQDFAIDSAARAYLLADDKSAFHGEPWVKDLIAHTIQLADAAEESASWYKAMRLYGDLGSIEPLNPKWKERLKTVMRRIQLLGTYAPDELKRQAESELKLREAADEVIRTADATTRPATRPTAETNDTFRIEWRDTVRGVQLDMLRDALRHARRDYWRDVTYVPLLTGGIEGLRAMATTPGLETAFPSLADGEKRDEFVTACNALVAAVREARSPNDDALMTSTLAQLWQFNRETIGLPEEVFTAEFAASAFTSLDDFTNMIWPYDIEEFNKSTQGEFQGVGIQIDSDDDGSLKVISPIEDTPAYRAGIKAGDTITHINGKNAKGITTTQAVKNITGPAGTTVRLTVRSPDGETREHELKRQKIFVASIKGWERRPGGGWDYMVDADSRIGYLRLTNFTKTTTEELDKAIRDLKAAGARAMILDLRYNPGGLLNAATEVSDRFLTGGSIVSTRGERRPQDEQVTRASPENTDIALPMVVLVNQYSASASEIVSGALRDQKRALVVGERTFGKGSVQMLFQIDGRAAFLKLTTSHYYLPNGECIHKEEGAEKWGVEPDVTIPMTNDQMRAANEVRRERDVLRDAADKPTTAVPEPAVAEAEAAPTTQPGASVAAVRKNLLDVDPQLSAAVLLLRLQLAGAQI